MCSPLCANTGPVFVIIPPFAYPLRDSFCVSCCTNKFNMSKSFSSEIFKRTFLSFSFSKTEVGSVRSSPCITRPILIIASSFSSGLNAAIIFFIVAAKSGEGLIILLVNAIEAALVPSTSSKKASASLSVLFPVKTPPLSLLYLSLYSCVKEAYTSFPPAALSISNLDS